MGDQIARLVEHQHRRRGDAASHRRRVALGSSLALVERAGPMDDPDAIEAVGPDAGDLAEEPVVRQRLRPEWIDLELRHRGFCGRVLGERGGSEQRQHGGAHAGRHFCHEVLPIWFIGIARSCRLRSRLLPSHIVGEYPGSVDPHGAICAPWRHGPSGLVHPPRHSLRKTALVRRIPGRAEMT